MTNASLDDEMRMFVNMSSHKRVFVKSFVPKLTGHTNGGG